MSQGVRDEIGETKNGLVRWDLSRMEGDKVKKESNDL